MKVLRFIGMVVAAVSMSISFTSCGGGSNNSAAGQSALDAALKRKGNAMDVQNSYIRSREEYKRMGDTKNAEYYDKNVKEQSKEIDRLHQEAEKIRKDTYGDVFK